jgi:hypothetical protein
MMRTAISFLSNAAFIAAIALFAVAFYQQTMFTNEWREDHSPTVDWLYRSLLSTVAMLSPVLSERCQRRRRLMLVATIAAFVLLLISVFLDRLWLSGPNGQ